MRFRLRPERSKKRQRERKHLTNPSYSLTGARAAVLILAQSVSGQNGRRTDRFLPPGRTGTGQANHLPAGTPWTAHLPNGRRRSLRLPPHLVSHLGRANSPVGVGRLPEQYPTGQQKYSGINPHTDCHQTGRSASPLIRMLTFLLATVADWFLFPWLFALLKWGIVLAFSLMTAGLLLWFCLC